MFQPTNPSYVHLMVESTIDRHMGESEAERAIREGTPYQLPQRRGAGRTLTHAFGIALMVFSQRLDRLVFPHQ